MNDDLLQFAPPKADLGIGMKWHVFISYRPSDRLWAIQLYDVLRHLDYQVFLDRMVLTAGADLLSQLKDGLEASASGIVVWSGTSADSQWLRTEYSLMEGLSHSRDFRYIVANLDGSRPPLFASQAIWVDFSSASDGPRGNGLLALLWGLAGKPLPAQAVRMALEVDERTTQDLHRIRAHLASGNADEIVAMARASHSAWTSTALLGCAAAEALVRLARYTDAISILESLRERFPNSLRPAQLLSLALMRLGRTDESQVLLGRLYEVGAKDSETLGMYAKSWMDRYRRSNDPVDLMKARDLYSEAFNRFPNDYYFGINAASASVFLGDLASARQVADRVKVMVGDAPSDDFWLLATGAEVELIRGQYDAAARAYRTAYVSHPYERGSLDSVWVQATRLLDGLGASPAQRAMIADALGQQTTQRST